MEEETQRQGGLDREVRVLRWRAPRARSLRFPGCDGRPGQPDCDVAPTDQGSLVGRPVSDAVFRLVFRMDSRLHPSSLVWVPLNLTLDLCNNARSGHRGGQRRYSDLAIETALTLRLLYHLPLRRAEGFLHALFGMMRLDLSVPDSTTLSRRSQHLQRCLRPVPPGEGLHLVLDSTGLSIVGQVSGRPRHMVAAAGVAGGSSTVASISQA